jgi:hypothetical protein
MEKMIYGAGKCDDFWNDFESNIKFINIYWN